MTPSAARPQKEFFYVAFWRSLTDRTYYRDVLRGKGAGFSVGYLFFLLVVTHVIGAVIIAAGFAAAMPKMPEIVGAIKGGLRDLYPAELRLEIKDGIASANVPQPYVVPFPPQWQPLFEEAKDEDRKIDSLLTIDTKASVESYPETRSIFLLTRDSLAAPGRNGQGYQVVPLDKETTMTVYHAAYDAFLEAASPYIDMFAIILKVVLLMIVTVLPILAAGLGLAGYALWLLLMALILWLVAMFAGRTLSYGTLYRLSLHGVTVAVLASFVLGHLGLPIPLLPTAAFLGWMTAVIYAFPADKKKPAAARATATKPKRTTRKKTQD